MSNSSQDSGRHSVIKVFGECLSRVLQECWQVCIFDVHCGRTHIKTMGHRDYEAGF